jgi:hypothetical protein
MGGIKPPEFRSSSNCLEGTQTGQGDDDRSTNQLAAALLFQGPDVELIGDRSFSACLFANRRRFRIVGEVNAGLF